MTNKFRKKLFLVQAFFFEYQKSFLYACYFLSSERQILDKTAKVKVALFGKGQMKFFKPDINKTKAGNRKCAITKFSMGKMKLKIKLIRLLNGFLTFC